MYLIRIQILDLLVLWMHKFHGYHLISRREIAAIRRNTHVLACISEDNVWRNGKRVVLFNKQTLVLGRPPTHDRIKCMPMHIIFDSDHTRKKRARVGWTKDEVCHALVMHHDLVELVERSTEFGGTLAELAKFWIGRDHGHNNLDYARNFLNTHAIKLLGC